MFFKNSSKTKHENLKVFYNFVCCRSPGEGVLNWPLLPHGQPLLPHGQPLLPHGQPLLPHGQPLLPHGQHM